MMEGYGQKRKLSMEHDHMPIELTQITVDAQQTNGRRQVKGKDVDVQTERIIGKDVHVQTELTAITFDEEETSFQPHVVSEDVEIKGDSPHQFDRPHLNMNGEEILDRRQVPVVIEVSGNEPDASMTNRRKADSFKPENTFLHNISSDIDILIMDFLYSCRLNWELQFNFLRFFYLYIIMYDI
jgi:hypothetical protein